MSNINMLKTALKGISSDFALGNISKANSKYLRLLNDLSGYSPFIAKAKDILRLQENEDWVGLADIFEELSYGAN